MKEKKILITDPKELDNQPEIQEIIKGLALVKENADLLIKTIDDKRIVIITDENIQSKVVDIRARIKKGKKVIKENMNIFIKPIDDIVKDFKAKGKTFIAPLDEYEEIMYDALKVYDQKLEYVRIAAQKKLDEEAAAKKAKEEKEKKELQDKIDAEKNETKKEELVDEHKKVEEKVETPIQQIIQSNNKIDTGKNKTSWKKNWKAKIINKKLFIEYALKCDRLECIDINQSEINKLAKEHEDRKQMPGLEFWNDKYLGR